MSASPLVRKNDAISDFPPQVTQAVLPSNEEAQSIREDQSGPMALARPTSDF